MATKKTNKKTVKKTTKKNTSKNSLKNNNYHHNDHSFLAFLGLLVISGFLIGGLVGSFNFYKSFVSQQTPREGVELPSTGLVSEGDLEAPVPETVTPGDIETNASNLSDTSDKEADPRQPVGTVEFNDGDYKVYQYPDGNIVVVW